MFDKVEISAIINNAIGENLIKQIYMKGTANMSEANIRKLIKELRKRGRRTKKVKK